MNVITPAVVQSIHDTLDEEFGPYGMEFKALKIGWYNSLVQPVFRIDGNEDTVAFLIISTPKLFEKAFIPFLKENIKTLHTLKDPIDDCMTYYLSKISEIFPGNTIQILHDFDLHPNRRPKIIMQAIAHASGAAYYYHPSCLPENNWPDQKLFGVCIHPKYGGWFALRAVVFFKDLYCPDLPETLPPDVVPNTEDRIKLLELYNFYWEDFTFRDIIPVSEKYSEIQRKYFSTPPGKRSEVVEYVLNANS